MKIKREKSNVMDSIAQTCTILRKKCWFKR